MQYAIAPGRAVFLRGEAFYPGDEERLPRLGEKDLVRLVRLGMLYELDEDEEIGPVAVPAEVPVQVPAEVPAATTETSTTRLTNRPIKIRQRRPRRRKRGEEPKPLPQPLERDLAAEERQDRTMARLAAMELEKVPEMLAEIDSSWEVTRLRYLDKRSAAKALYDTRLKELAG